MSFGGHLRALREGAGLSRAELARRAGVPATTLRNWETDRGYPSLPVLQRLAGALGVPVERLAKGTEDPGGNSGKPDFVPDEVWQSFERELYEYMAEWEASLRKAMESSEGGGGLGKQPREARPRGSPAKRRAKGSPKPAPKKERGK
jgi:transcriptional regulator with XRE-family HTH domain